MKQFGKFNVRLLFAGDKYGRDDCLTVDGAPMVEFYDATQDPETFGERGQFTGGRYYVATLLLEWSSAPWRKGVDELVPANQGLDLCGHVAAWKVSGDDMARVRAWMVAQLIERATATVEVSDGK